ncbi:MAG: hypothetical protein K2Y51_25955 [Gammaproteobacteria bacterium]|nr:hypothetical protein [Gammaproteobacteria bacterium]
MASPEFQTERLNYFLKGYRPAIDFVATFSSLCQVWDDLVDGDRPVTADDINRAFEGALLHLAVDPFYQEHFAALHILVRMGINAWLDSNKLIELGGKDHLILAYVLRDLVGEVAIASAGIVGGYEWMREVSLDIRLDLLNDEPFEDFVRGLGDVD